MVKGKTLKRPAGDFTKTKAKVGRAAPKPANYTDTSFRTKRIKLREQSVVGHEGVAGDGGGEQQSLQWHNKDVKQLVSLTSHHNPKSRRDAFEALNELMLRTEYDANAFSEFAPTLALGMLDHDSASRQAFLALLTSWLTHVERKETLIPHLNTYILTAISCMTSAHDSIDKKLDATVVVQLLHKAFPFLFLTVLDRNLPTKLLQLYTDLSRTVLGTSSSSLARGTAAIGISNNQATSHHQGSRRKSGILASFKAQEKAATATIKKKKSGTATAATQVIKAENASNITRVYRAACAIREAFLGISVVETNPLLHDCLLQANLVSIELLRHMNATNPNQRHVAEECIVLGIEACIKVKLPDTIHVLEQAKDVFEEYGEMGHGDDMQSVWSVKLALQGMRVGISPQEASWVQHSMNWIKHILDKTVSASSLWDPILDECVLTVVGMDMLDLDTRCEMMKSIFHVLERTESNAELTRMIDILVQGMDTWPRTCFTPTVRQCLENALAVLPRKIWTSCLRANSLVTSNIDAVHVTTLALNALTRFVLEFTRDDDDIDSMWSQTLAKNLGPQFYAFKSNGTNTKSVRGPWFTVMDDDSRRCLCGLLVALRLKRLPSNLFKSLVAAACENHPSAVLCVELPFLMSEENPVIDDDDDEASREYRLATFACTVAIKCLYEEAREVALGRILCLIQIEPGLCDVIERGLLALATTPSSRDGGGARWDVWLRVASCVVGTLSTSMLRIPVLKALAHAWVEMGNDERSPDIVQHVALAMIHLTPLQLMVEQDVLIHLTSPQQSNQAIKGLLSILSTYREKHDDRLSGTQWELTTVF